MSVEKVFRFVLHFLDEIVQVVTSWIWQHGHLRFTQQYVVVVESGACMRPQKHSEALAKTWSQQWSLWLVGLRQSRSFTHCLVKSRELKEFHEEEDVQEPIAPPPQPEEQGWHAQPLFPARSLAVRKGKSKPQKPLNAAAQSSESFLTSVPRMRLTIVSGCHVFYSGQCLYMCFCCG